MEEKRTRRTPEQMLAYCLQKLETAKDRVVNKPRRGQVRRSSEEMVEHWSGKVKEAQRRADANPLDRQVLKIGRQAKTLQEALVAAENYCPEVASRLGDLVEAVEETL